MHAMAEALMQFETIDQNQIADIMAGKKPRKTTSKSKPKSGSTAAKTSTKTAKKTSSDSEFNGLSTDNLNQENNEGK